MLLSLDNVRKSYGAELIFSGVTARIEDRDRIGLVGINGAGKTTLLNIIAGELGCDSGEIARGGGFSVGYLRQNSGLVRENTIIQEMRSVFADVYRAEAEMQRLASEHRALSEEYRAAEDLFLARDGYNVGVRINTVLSGMGFYEHGYDKVIDKLSGGEQTRLAIAKLLLEQPSLLILDEPTNHLDFRTLSWLEDYLSGWKGALLTVSHDRYFLDRLCNKIWEMEAGELTVYGGNYTRYLQLRDEADVRRRKVYEAQREEIAKMEEYVDKNLVRASTTKMAQSRRKAAEKAKEQLERPKRALKPPKIRLSYAEEPISSVLKVRDLDVAVGEGGGRKTLLTDVKFEIKRGEKTAIIGANGTGKTTLLRFIIGESPCGAGRIDWGRGVKYAYYSQGSDTLDGDLTVLDTMREHYPYEAEHMLRGTLGAMGLTGDDAFKYVRQLSGGERARLKLAVICLSGSNVLILDEPTNHLDLITKEVLEDALSGYTGTIIMVSHDRYLLDRIPDRIFALENGKLNIYKGGYSEYLRLSAEQRGAEERTDSVKTRELSENAAKHYRSKQDRQAEAKRRKDYSDTEKLIGELEEKSDWLRNEIDGSSKDGTDYKKLQELCAEAEECEKELSKAMDRWVELGSRLGEQS